MRHRKALLLLATLSCTPVEPGPTPDAGTNPGTDGGPQPGSCPTGFCTTVLEPEQTDRLPLSMALKEDGTVGVAYFHRVSESDFELRYREWRAGTVSEASVLATVQRVFGVSLAFTGEGRPAVAYLGGEGGGEDADSRAFWKQSDTVVAYRQADGSWRHEVVARDGDEVLAGNPVSDNGNVVGLHPALGFSGQTAFVAWRDVHFGQFAGAQDYPGSDLEVAVGGPGAWQKAVVVAGGNDKRGYGGRKSLVVVDGQPALAWDRQQEGPDAIGKDVYFSRRQEDGSWTTKQVADVFDTQQGPSLAHDAQTGFGVVVTERTQSRLDFYSSRDGEAWSVPDPLFQSGSGGWWPSLAFSPDTHEPHVAYYVCARRGGVAETECPEGEDELKLAERRADSWRHTLVDEEGGFAPKLAFLADGRRVLAYRHPTTGVLKLAVEE